MSILRFINGKNRNVSQLKGSLLYIFNPVKVLHQCRGSTGAVCDEAYQDMRILKILHNKTVGRQYVHFVLSFDADVDYQTAFEVSDDVLGYFEGKYQVVFSVHENTANVHTHFILNSVAVDGHKFRQSRAEMLKFRDWVNETLEEYELNPIGKITMQCVDDYPELDRFLKDTVFDQDEMNIMLDEYFDSVVDDYNDDEEDIETFDDECPMFQEAYVPIWFGEKRPYIPIWFDETQIEKTLVYEPIKFFDEEETDE